MLVTHLATVETGSLVRAGTVVAVTLVALYVVKRAFDRRAHRIATALGGGQLTAEADTRLRFIQRLLSAAIFVIGVFLALNQFTGISDLASKILASGAIAAAILGFAARATLGNIIAGVMLAITQPVRVGDWIEAAGHYGVVEDVTLNFTILRTGSDQRVVIPNEQIASSAIRNDTLGSPQVALDVSVWIAPDADVQRAVASLEEETGASVSVVESSPVGIRLAVGGDPAPPSERPAREAQLRATALARLHAEGLLARPGA